MNPKYSFILRFLAWSPCSFCLRRTAFILKSLRFAAGLIGLFRFLGAIITLWLAGVAWARAFGMVAVHRHRRPVPCRFRKIDIGPFAPSFVRLPFQLFGGPLAVDRYFRILRGHLISDWSYCIDTLR